jgi:2-oxo-3-(phosphooxy)propyl 3-oxoalkanoate synthase
LFEVKTFNLSYAATVPRQLVHRSAICEVFLTDSRRLGEGEFLLAAQLPRVHSYFSDHLSRISVYDPLLIMECCRQASVYIAHQYCDAPTDHKFILNESEITVTDLAALAVGRRPGHAVLRAEVISRKHREGVLVGFGLRISVSVDDRAAAAVDIAIQWMPPEAWDRLRARGRAALELGPVTPGEVTGRLRPDRVARLAERNVVLADAVIAGAEVVTELAIDHGHPGLFDHPLDHVPGMLLFEALRQTALVTAHELLGLSPTVLFLTGCAARFTRFGEFELPVRCRAVLSGAAAPFGVEITVSQGEDLIGTGTVRLSTASPLEPAWRAEPVVAAGV